MKKSEMRIIAHYMKTAPVNLEAIFSELGIDYEPKSMFGASGSIERRGERFVISVNADESRNRQRFTAAHELAHYLIHRDLLVDDKKMHRDYLFDGGSRPEDGVFDKSYEIEANRIAAQIIMPRSLVKEEFRKEPNPSELAKKFQVSEAAMKIRLESLSLT